MSDLGKIDKTMRAFEKSCFEKYGREAGYGYIAGFQGSIMRRLLTAVSPEDQKWVLDLMKKHTKTA